MPGQAITVDNQLFVGRVEEQKQFRAALAELLDPPAKESLPYVCLLYGDGGSGKTTLAKRFRDIAGKELPYKGKFRTLWIDWEDERRKFPGLQVGRRQISPETVFKVIHAAAIREKWGRQFNAYNKAVTKRDVASKKVVETIVAENDWDELAILRSIGVDALGKIVRTRIPGIGDTGEEIVEAFLDAGIQVGAEQAAKLAQVIEKQLRIHLKPDHYDYFLNPNEQLAVALAQGLSGIAKRQRLIIVLDTYEIIDQVDIWIRAVMRAAGPRVMWVIAGRNNLVQSRMFGSRYFKGYADDTPRRLLAYSMLPLSIDDIRTYLTAVASVEKPPIGSMAASKGIDTRPKLELTEGQVEAISRVTRGIPLAVKEAADIWRAGVSFEDIVGDIDDANAGSQIVQRITDGYLQHVVLDSDKHALFALALAEGDVDILRAMLRPDDGTPFDLDSLLRRLERDYVSVHAERARLHDTPAVFLKDYLQSEVQRTSDQVRTLNMRAIETLRMRLEGLEAELSLIEERCQDDNWVKSAISMAHYLFWLNESEAWHWIIPRYVEGLAHNQDLKNGLIKIVEEWKGLSDNTERLYNIINRATEDSETLFKVLARLESRGWLDGQNADERKTILRLFSVNQLADAGQAADALEILEQVEATLPNRGALLQEQLADGYSMVARRLIWSEDRYTPSYSPDADRILRKTLAWIPEKSFTWYLLGVNLGAAGMNDEAISALQKAITINPNLVAAYNSMGYIYKEMGQHDEARKAYDKALQLDPSSARSHGGLGQIHQVHSQPEQAIASYEQAIQQDSGFVEAHIGLGQMYLTMDRPADALAAFEKSRTSGNDQPSVFNGIGDAHQKNGENEKALAAYKRAIELKPTYAQPYAGIGLVYHALGKPEASLAAFKKAIQLDTQAPEPYLGLGEMYEDSRRYDKAILSYEKTISLGLKTADIYERLARVYKADGQFLKALEAHNTAKTIEPEIEISLENLGDIYLALGSYDQARDAYLESASINGDKPGPYTGLGNTLGAMGRYKEAITAFEQATSIDPGFVGAYCGQGSIYQKQGATEKSILAYRRAIELDPNDLEAHIGLGNAYVANSQYKKAIDAYKQAQGISDKDARPYKGLGEVYLRINMPNAAKEAFENAITRDSQLTESYTGLGEALLGLRHYRRAITTFQQAIQNNPSDTVPLISLSRLYIEHGHYDEARETINKALEIDPDSCDANEALGDLLLSQGKQTEAIRAYSEILGRHPEDSSALNKLGSVYCDLGRTNEALEVFQKALALNLKDPVA